MRGVEPANGRQERGPGLPAAGVRAVMSVLVVLVAAAVSGYLLVEAPGSDLAKVAVGGWLAALGNVIGFYFGTRSAS